MLNRALVQYAFDGPEHYVLNRPHGNSKRKEGYVRTLPSTLHHLQKVSSNSTPKYAIQETTAAVGGLMEAKSAGSLPRNQQQASNIRRRLELSGGKHKDPLFSVMQMCKESEGNKTIDSFVRVVNAAPEPMAVLAFDWTLNDLEKFCTVDNPLQSILTVDPTFNLGDFNVTVTTYRHPLLTNSSGKNPSMVGPLFIHQQKKFESYYFFASSLVGLNPRLKNIHAFGTDGEKALFDAFNSVFSSALHVRCFLHFRGNLDAKLKSLGIAKKEIIEFLHDIFGNPNNLEEGLVDAANEEEFEKTLSEFHEIWNAREAKYNNPPQFYTWFVANCQEAVQTTMLKSHRVQVGLGDPPKPRCGVLKYGDQKAGEIQSPRIAAVCFIDE